MKSFVLAVFAIIVMTTGAMAQEKLTTTTSPAKEPGVAAAKNFESFQDKKGKWRWRVFKAGTRPGSKKVFLQSWKAYANRGQSESRTHHACKAACETASWAIRKGAVNYYYGLTAKDQGKDTLIARSPGSWKAEASAKKEMAEAGTLACCRK